MSNRSRQSTHEPPPSFALALRLGLRLGLGLWLGLGLGRVKVKVGARVRFFSRSSDLRMHAPPFALHRALSPLLPSSPLPSLPYLLSSLRPPRPLHSSPSSPTHRFAFLSVDLLVVYEVASYGLRWAVFGTRTMWAVLIWGTMGSGGGCGLGIGGRCGLSLFGLRLGWGWGWGWGRASDGVKE